jgi:hypothetical protein
MIATNTRTVPLPDYANNLIGFRASIYNIACADNLRCAFTLDDAQRCLEARQIAMHICNHPDLHWQAPVHKREQTFPGPLPTNPLNYC